MARLIVERTQQRGHRGWKVGDRFVTDDMLRNCRPEHVAHALGLPVEAVEQMRDSELRQSMGWVGYSEVSE